MEVALSTFNQTRAFSSIPIKVRKTGITYPGCSKSEVVFIRTLQGEKKSHIKYESSDQLWCELLADEIYRTLGILVPETQALVVSGELVRGSSWIEGHIPTQEEFVKKINSGFIADSLLANWDIVAKLNNSIIEDKTGDLYRTDNGGSLLFRACGERKDNFISIVPELESMRHSYPALAEEEIKRQVLVLQDKLTDIVIEGKVDSTNLSNEDNLALKLLLKQRRDYIIAHFSKDEDDPIEIPQVGKEVEKLLVQEPIHDEKLSKIVSEWARHVSDSGYDSSKKNVGEETKSAIKVLKTSARYSMLDTNERNLILLAHLFYNLGKPTGKLTDSVIEDPNFKERSVHKATTYMSMWGYSRKNILIVNNMILHPLDFFWLSSFPINSC